MLDHDAAASFYDTLVRFLRLGLRTVLVFGLIVALAGFLTGTLGYRGTSSCRRSRPVSAGCEAVLKKLASAPGRYGAWVYRYKRVLWIAVLAIAALVLVFWNRPTGKVIIGLATRVLVVLVIIEFLGRPPSPAPPVTADAESTAGAASTRV